MPKAIPSDTSKAAALFNKKILKITSGGILMLYPDLINRSKTKILPDISRKIKIIAF